MAQHQAGFAAWIVTVEGVHVGTADAYRIDAQHDLSIDQTGLRAIEQLHFQRLGVDEGFHGVISCARSGLISRWSNHRAWWSGRRQVTSNSPIANCLRSSILA